MTDRLFFALWPDEQQRRALTRIQRELSPCQGRSIHPQDLHMTLVFLGDLDAQRRACSESVGDRVRAVPFALSLNRIGCFPRARVLWCGAPQCPEPLSDLVHALNRGLLDCGFRPEERPFHPHVTLARRARPLSARELEQPIRWLVSEFALVLARPGERPRYRVACRWPLIP